MAMVLARRRLARVVVRTGTSVVIVAFVGLVSCSHGLLEREISGQVFVVRNDGQSVKLGLVEVQIFDANDLANQLRSASLTNDQAEAEKLKKRVEQFEPELNRVVDRLSELAHAVPLESGDVSLPHLKSSGQGLIIVDFPRLKMDVSQYADYLRSAAYLFTKIAIKPLALAKTDADGKFTVRVPRGRNLAAVAAAQRYVGDSEELYFWAVNVPGNTIALSNDNEDSSPRGESLVHCPSFHQRMMSDLKEKPELEARLADLIQQASNLLTQAEPGHVTIGSIKLLRPVSIQVGSGTSILPAGTELNYSVIQNGYLRVHYANTTYWVPQDQTDFSSHH